MLTFGLRAVGFMLTVLLTLMSFAIADTPPAASEAGLPVTDQPKREQEAEITLHILQSRGEIGFALQQAADLYAETHPGLRLTVQTIGNESDYRVALRQKLFSGERADLFQVLGRQDGWELRDYLGDLSGLGWVGEAAGGLAEPLNFDGAWCGVPYSIEGVGLIANRNIFELAGIPLAGIDDFADLEEALQKLKKMISEGELEEDFPGLEAVTELPAQDRSYLEGQLAAVALTGEFPTAAYAAGSEFIAMPGAEGAGKLIDLLAGCCVSGKRTSMLNTVTQNRQVELGIALQRVAIVLQNTDIAGRVQKTSPALAGRLALLPIPLEGGEGQGGVYISAPAYWAVNADASEESKKAARDFLSWLYRSQAGAEILAGRFDVLSPYRETAQKPQSVLQEELLSYIERGEYLPNPRGEYPQGWGSGSFAAGLQEYFAGDREWREFVARCCEDWHRLR